MTSRFVYCRKILYALSVRNKHRGYQVPVKQEEVIMSNFTTNFTFIPTVFIGIDAHTTNYTMSSLTRHFTGTNFIQIELVPTVKGVPMVKQVLKYIAACKAALAKECNIICAYEAGGLGFSLQRQLAAHDVDCIIMAPTTMKFSQRDKKFKNDKRDSIKIAECLANGDYSPVHVPDEEDEDIRNYIRMRDDHAEALKRFKQQFLAYLNTLNVERYPANLSKWTQRHLDWVRKLDVSDMQREIIHERLLTISQMEDKVKAFEDNIQILCQRERYCDKVSHLRCFLGIEYTLALRLIVEISDFKRFKKAGDFASFLGLTPIDRSSSDDINRGGITKAGNCSLRKRLIESCWPAFGQGKPAFKSKMLKAKQKDCPEEIIAYADRGNERLRRRFRRLVAKGKEKNKAIVAVAREYACFIWGMMTGNTELSIKR